MIQVWLERLGIRFNTKDANMTKKRSHSAEHIPSILICEQDLVFQNECCICLEEFDPNESVYCIPCGHYFHVHCLMEWEQRRPTCPTCETSIYGTGGLEIRKAKLRSASM